jgi:SAM-dependent methyltransferase
MIWLSVLALLVLLLVIFAVRPMKIPREPGREGPQEGDAVVAYNRTSRWPVFIIERRIILHEIIKDKPRGLLLDIGCGPGFLAADISLRFKNNTVVGLDINEQMIDIAERRWSSNSNLSFLLGDAQELPFADHTIDYIVSSLSLHHWKNVEKVFNEIYRVLKPGGRFIIFDLRRDGQAYFYYSLKIGQALVAPKAIRDTNGAIGSFWSAFTPSEVKIILENIPLEKFSIEPHFGWMIIHGSKSEKPQL